MRPAPSPFLLQISFPNIVPNNRYFFIEKRIFYVIYPSEMMLLDQTSLSAYMCATLFFCVFFSILQNWQTSCNKDVPRVATFA